MIKNLFDNFNFVNYVDWGIDAKEFEYKKPSELDPNVAYPLRGFYISSMSEFGPQAVFISDTFKVNCPKGYVEKVKELLKDEECIEAVKNNLCAFKVERYYVDKYNTYGYHFKIVTR